MATILKIYGKDGCRDCKALLAHIVRKGVPYEYIDVEKDAAALAHIKGLGYQTLPVGEYGEDHWSGVRVDKIAALAPRRLSKAS